MNNKFDFNYDDKISEYLNSSDPISKEKKEELKEAVRSGKGFLFHKRLTPEQKEKILTYFDKLIDSKPGAELIDRLLKSKCIVEIKSGARHHSLQGKKVKSEDVTYIYSNKFRNYSKTTGKSKVFLTFNDRLFELSGKNKDDLEVTKMKKIVVFAHELIHALHDAEKTEKIGKDLLDHRYHDEEEQYTITGIYKDKKDWQFEPLCENIFRAVFDKKQEEQGLSYRFFHIAWDKNTKAAWTLSDDILAAIDHPELLGKIKRSIQDRKFNLNESYPMFSKNITSRPLTMAIESGQEEIIKEMVKRDDLEVEYVDEIGHPLLFALTKPGDLEIALLLASHTNCKLALNADQNQILLDSCLSYGKLNTSKETWMKLMDTLLEKKEFKEYLINHHEYIAENIKNNDFLRDYFLKDKDLFPLLNPLLPISEKNFVSSEKHPLTEIIFQGNKERVQEYLKNEEIALDYMDPMGCPLRTALSAHLNEGALHGLEIAQLIADDKRCQLNIPESEIKNLIHKCINYVTNLKTDEDKKNYVDFVSTLLEKPKFKLMWNISFLKNTALVYGADFQETLIEEILSQNIPLTKEDLLKFVIFVLDNQT